MSQLLSILFFGASTYGLGTTLTRWVKESDEPLERHLMRVGFGLPLFLLIGILLNIANIPLNWWIFLILALPAPAWELKKFLDKRKEIHQHHETHHHKGFSIKRASIYTGIAVMVAIVCLFMYTKGAFSYAQLEDGDPWHHAVSTKYVAQEKSFYTPHPDTFRYLDAYPPGYALLMGMTYQISQDMVWNLKFFNALFIALGVIFFFGMARHLVKDDRTATIATVILAMIPAYFSHFIWAHTLSVALFFPVFYAAILSKEKGWSAIGAIALGGMILTQPTQPIKGMVMLGFLGLGHLLTDKKRWKSYLIILIGGILLSGLWWGAMSLRFDDVLREGLNQKPSTNERWQSSSHFGPLGSATRDYSLSDFISVSSQNMMTAPVGIGWAPMMLALIGLIAILLHKKKLFKSESFWVVILGWSIFTILGLYGGTKLPLALFTFRFWLLAPIPLALLAAKGVEFVATKAKGVGVPQIATILILIAICGWTAGAVKYDLNTMQWPSEPAMMKYNQMDGYEYLRALPKDTKVFNLCHRDKFGDTVLISYDKYACPWCEEVRQFRDQAKGPAGWQVTPEQIESFMKKHKYQYLFIEGNCVDTLRKYLRDEQGIEEDLEFLSANSTQTLFTQIGSAGLFQPVHQTQGSVVFKTI